MDEFIAELEAPHHIQREILRKLTYKTTVTYAELLPDGMSGNAFNYHLNNLLKHKIVSKNSDGYTVTALGRVVIDGMSLEEKRFKLRPACGVLLYVEHVLNGEILLYKSTRQPLMGYIGLPFGKLRIGETFEQTAMRMIERRHLNTANIKKMCSGGVFNVIYRVSDSIVAHRAGEIWRVIYSGEMEDTQTPNGSGFWEGNSDSGEAQNIKNKSSGTMVITL